MNNTLANSRFDITAQSQCVQQAVPFYQELHQNPELSLEEYETAERIERVLSSWGVWHKRCGETGIIASISSGKGPIVAFRSDHDALPIEENTGCEFASTKRVKAQYGGKEQEVPVMHACGHDVHTSCALGAMHYFLHHKDSWQGTIHFVFQPSEENAAGALKMVNDGLWHKVEQPQVLLGQHVGPVPLGIVATGKGSLLSRADNLRVTVKGIGGHASSPQDGMDPIVLVSHMITRLQTIVSRNVAPLDNAVVTVGTVHGGLTNNVICEEVQFTINTRTYGNTFEETVYPAIERIIHGEAIASGAEKPVIEKESTFTEVINDPESTELVVEAFRREFGKEMVVDFIKTMGSEDFNELADAINIPYVYWFFGAFTPEYCAERTRQGKKLPGNHSPEFMPDSPADCLAMGIKTAVTGITQCLEKLPS